MAHPCVSCNHPNREQLDSLLTAGASLATVARQFGLTEKSVGRHRAHHLSAALVRVSAEAADASARTALARIEDLAGRLERALERADKAGHTPSLVSVARELRSSVELLAKLSGELKPDGPTVQVLNLQASPDWVATRSALMAALKRHPEALADVSTALARLEGVRALGPGDTP